MNTQERIGIDFGKVIMCAIVNGVQDTSFLGVSLEEAMSTPASVGAIDCIGQLVERYAGRVYIVSKCGPSVEKKTRAWLKHNAVYERTGLQQRNLHFCRKREGKAPICKKIGVTHFVDDRLDVLKHMVGIVPKLYLFGEQAPALRTPSWAQPLADWEEVRVQLLS